MSKVTMTKFQHPFSEEIWRSTYKDYKDETIDDTFRRVAKAIAAAEETEEAKQEWTEKFYDMFTGFKVVPGGRILSNAGTEWQGTTMINCFVSPRQKESVDSLEGIIANLRNQALTLKAEGGWGENFCIRFDQDIFVKRDGTEIKEKIENVKSGDLVLSSDSEWHLVEDTLESIKENMVELTLENGETIHCTDDHHFLVERDDNQVWVMAKDLLPLEETIVSLIGSRASNLTASRFYQEKTKVIDLQVAGSHNFALGNSRIIAHNSHLRPRGSMIQGIGVESPGAVKYMELFDKSSEIVTSGSGKKSKNPKAKGKIRKGAMMGIMDCFSKDTIILTDQGWMNIVDIISLVEDGKIIYAITEDGSQNLIKNPIVKPPNDIYKIETEDGSFIEVTGDHKFEVLNIETNEVYLKSISEIDIEKEMLKMVNQDDR